MKQLTNRQLSQKARNLVVFALVTFAGMMLLAYSPLTQPKPFNVSVNPTEQLTPEDCATNPYGCVRVGK